MAGPTCTPASRSSSPSSKMPCGKGKGICPADVEARLDQYSENTQHLVGYQHQAFISRIANKISDKVAVPKTMRTVLKTVDGRSTNHIIR